MDKIKVVGRKKYEDHSIYFYFKKLEDVHVLLSDMFFKLGVQDKDLEEIDIIFDDLDDIFFHFCNDLYTINVFVTTNCIHIFVKPKNQKYKNELVRILREYFEY